MIKYLAIVFLVNVALPFSWWHYLTSRPKIAPAPVEHAAPVIYPNVLETPRLVVYMADMIQDAEPELPR